jgi:hypothetical protein
MSRAPINMKQIRAWAEGVYAQIAAAIRRWLRREAWMICYLWMNADGFESGQKHYLKSDIC